MEMYKGQLEIKTGLFQRPGARGEKIYIIVKSLKTLILLSNVLQFFIKNC